MTILAGAAAAVPSISTAAEVSIPSTMPASMPSTMPSIISAMCGAAVTITPMGGIVAAPAAQAGAATSAPPKASGRLLGGIPLPPPPSDDSPPAEPTIVFTLERQAVEPSNGAANESDGGTPPVLASTDVGGQPVFFEVDLEKRTGEKLAVDVMLVMGNKVSGLVVERVDEGGCMHRWNTNSNSPYKVQSGDYIVQVNGVAGWQNLQRMAEELLGDKGHLRLVVQRSPQSTLQRVPLWGSGMRAPADGEVLQQESSQEPAGMVVPRLPPGPPPGPPPPTALLATLPDLHGGVAAEPHLPQRPSQQQNKKAAQTPVAGAGASNATAGGSSVTVEKGGNNMFLPEPSVTIENQLTRRAPQASSAPASNQNNNKSRTTAPATGPPAGTWNSMVSFSGGRPTAQPIRSTAEDVQALAAATEAASRAGRSVKEFRTTTCRDGKAMPSPAPAQLLLAALQLSDEDLTGLLRWALLCRPWLSVPVVEGLNELKTQSQEDRARALAMRLQ